MILIIIGFLIFMGIVGFIAMGVFGAMSAAQAKARKKARMIIESKEIVSDSKEINRIIDCLKGLEENQMKESDRDLIDALRKFKKEKNL